MSRAVHVPRPLLRALAAGARLGSAAFLVGMVALELGAIACGWVERRAARGGAA